jgi:hypothetical protein
MVSGLKSVSLLLDGVTSLISKFSATPDASQNAPYASHVYANYEKYINIRESAEDRQKVLNRPSFWSGDPIDPVDAPVSLYCETKQLGHAKLPDFFFTGEDTLVSDFFIKQLADFHIGDIKFYPTTIYTFDKNHVVSTEYSVMRIGNLKKGLVPENSEYLVANEFKPWTYMNSYVFGGGNIKSRFSLIALAKSVINGPEIWIDPHLKGAVFFSESLANALVDAGLNECLFMTQCKVV